MRFACLFMVLLTGSAFAAEPGVPDAHGRCYALLVGCTRYPSLPLGFQLRGPANDVLLMKDLLVEHFGFPEEHVVVLSEAAEGEDRRPTRANIERELDSLPERAGPGDQVVIFLAGHGSQQPDDDPQDPDDPEPDGLDEIFLPADVGPWDGEAGRVERAVVDDEIRRWLGAIRKKGASTWVIVDACHSGTMVRGAVDEVPRQVPPEEIVPAGALEAARQRAASAGGSSSIRSPSAELPQHEGGIAALYAAQSTEPTVEKYLPPDADRRKHHGLLTYTLNQVLRQCQAPLTYRELARAIHQQYVQWGRVYPTPLAEGADLDREVLGLATWPARSRIRLTREGERGVQEGERGVQEGPEGWQINAGTLHGMTAGSVLAVYRPAGHAGSDEPLGHVRVVEARALDSAVEPVDYADLPAPTELPEDGRCKLVFHDYGDFRLRLAIDPTDLDGEPVSEPQHKSVLEALHGCAGKESSFIALVDDPSRAGWLVRLGQERAYLAPASGWTEPGSTAASVPATQALYGPAPLDDSLPDWLEANLGRIARATNLRSLAAQADGSFFATKTGVNIEVELVRFAGLNDARGEVVAWDNGRTLRQGDIVAFRVRNDSIEPVDVTFLFIDADYGITAFFPRPGFLGDNRVRPGRELLSPRARATATPGPEHMVVIAVKAQGQAVDFSFLAQPSLERARGASARRGTESPLEQLLWRSMYATGQTRGLDTQSIDDHAVRLISWRVLDR